MNEEDIKNIEYSLLINNGFNGMGLVDIPTLKKLYEKYKELEEENKNYKKYAVMMSTEGLIINGVKFSFNDYISKSKVEEKIEELNDYDSKFCKRVLKHNENTLTELIQKILQELLQEGE